MKSNRNYDTEALPAENVLSNGYVWMRKKYAVGHWEWIRPLDEGEYDGPEDGAVEPAARVQLRESDDGAQWRVNGEKMNDSGLMENAGLQENIPRQDDGSGFYRACEVASEFIEELA